MDCEIGVWEFGELRRWASRSETIRVMDSSIVEF